MIMKVKDCMCKEVVFVKPDCDTEDCAKLMCQNHIGCIPVCDDNKKVVGLVTDRDILLRTIGCGKDIKYTPVSDIMTCNITCCNPEDEVQHAEKEMETNQVRRIPVMENNKIVGILTLGDLAKNKEVNPEGVRITLENICNSDKKNAE